MEYSKANPERAILEYDQHLGFIIWQPLIDRNPLPAHIGNPPFRVVFPIRYASEPADAADGCAAADPAGYPHFSASRDAIVHSSLMYPRETIHAKRSSQSEKNSAP
jgi:hypothetical protein